MKLLLSKKKKRREQLLPAFAVRQSFLWVIGLLDGAVKSGGKKSSAASTSGVDDRENLGCGPRKRKGVAIRVDDGRCGKARRGGIKCDGLRSKADVVVARSVELGTGGGNLA